jgi:hypothetical protein
MIFLRTLFALSLLAWLPSASAADYAALKTPLASLTGSVAELLISGGSKPVKLTQAEIERLPIYQTTLTTHWGQRGTFQGVLLTDLLKAQKLIGRPLSLVALDGYRDDLSVSDIESSPAILATRLNGRPISYADKGPFILLWPQKEQLALQGKMRLSDWIWGLNEIRAK